MDINKVYWLAGILEGEGSFGHYTRTPMVSLQMVDDDTVAKVRSIMCPNYKISIINRRTSKTIYGYNVYGTIAAQWMMTLYPLMSRRRKEKIREALEKWREQKNYYSDEEKFIRMCEKLGLDANQLAEAAKKAKNTVQ